MKNILVIGATGSIGQLVVKQALEAGYQVHALVRNTKKVAFDPRVALFEGDLTQANATRGFLSSKVNRMRLSP